MPEQIDILDGGTIFYHEEFYPKDQTEALFARLRDETPWAQERSRMGPFPRLTAWYADAGLAYSYSGVTHHAIAWTPTLLQIRHEVEAAANAPFNSLLLNFYRDGRDSIGPHSDAEPELGASPVIASLSFGAVRSFVLKHIRTGAKLKYDLAPGSLLVMGGTCQHHWVHGVPKTKAIVGPRINLTFRNIIAAR